MHDQLFRHQDQLRPRDLLDHAAAVGLDLARFTRDLGESRFARRVQDDLTSAEVSGVTGTPTFFIGGRRHSGPFDAATLAEALLAAAGEDLEPPAAAPERPMAPPPMLGARRDPERRGQQVPAVQLPADLPETPDTQGAFPRLSDAQLALLEQCGGRRRPVRRGEALFREGDDGYDFFVVLAGTVAVVENHGRAGQRLVSVHGPRRFLGELDIFTPGVVSLTAVLLTDGEVLWLQEDQLYAAKAADSSFSDLVLRAFLVRRSILLELAADVRILGYPDTPGTERLRAGAAERGLDTVVVDVEAAGGAALLEGLGVTADDLPVVVARDGTIARSPDGPQWEDLLRHAQSGGVVAGE
jgi:CRP-like cAMP-binding protein